MILDDKVVVLFRVVVYPKATIVFYKNTESGKEVHCTFSDEIIERDRLRMIHMSKKSQSVLFIGYSCHEFDCYVINYLIDAYDITSPSDIYYFVKYDINEENESLDAKKYFYSLDMKLIYQSEKLRLSFDQLCTSLNEDYFFMESNENFDITKVIAHSCMGAMEKLLNIIEPKIRLRLDLYYDHRVNAMNVDDVLMGIRYMTKAYLDKTKEDRQKFTSGRTSAQLAKLSEIIKYKPQTNPLKAYLAQVGDTIINPEKTGKEAWNTTLNMHNVMLSIAQGGVHSITKPSKFICKDDEVIIKYDFTSMFPTVMVNLNLFPRHFKAEFAEVYNSIRLERIKAKIEGNKLLNELYKKVINSAIGLMGSDWSYMYDPLMNSSVRLNAEFITLDLVELLGEYAKIIQVNIDGVFILAKKSDEIMIHNRVSDFMSKANMPFETEYYSKMFQLSVNDYVALDSQETLIRKGAFARKEAPKSFVAPIIAEAAVNNLIYNIPIKTTIDSCQDWSMFLMTTNVDNRFTVYIGDALLPNHVRYYYNKCAPYLTRKSENSETVIDRESGATVVYEIASICPEKIDKLAYSRCANKITSQFLQTELFM